MTSGKHNPLPRNKDFYSIDNLNEPIQDGAAFNEIASAVMRLRAALQKAGFEPPKAIELASHRDGDRMRHILPRDLIMSQAVEGRHDSNPDVMFNIMGVEFRYPAAFRGRPGGGFDII